MTVRKEYNAATKKNTIDQRQKDKIMATPKPIEVFYSYSHQDEKLRKTLEKHLKFLQRDGIISSWHDRKISPGDEWKGEIDSHLKSAQIILLLISADFIASDYCYDIEMKRAMKRHAAGEAKVIPIILRACEWQNAPFGKLQALPTDGKPVKSWSNSAEAFTNIAQGLKRIVLGKSEVASNSTTRSSKKRVRNSGTSITSRLQVKTAYPNAQISGIHIEHVDSLEVLNADLQQLSTVAEAPAPLSSSLEETLALYMATNFERDRYSKLDQAGETDPDRSTLLRQVFVDLDATPRNGPQPRRLLASPILKRFYKEIESVHSERRNASDNSVFPTLRFCLSETWHSIVLIGGPGQGKSTLGQYLAQVHRAYLLKRESEIEDQVIEGINKQKFVPVTTRVPFRVILKYFAQWLADKPEVNTLETYLTQQIAKESTHTIAEEDLHVVLRQRACLLILDGLDEVYDSELRTIMLAKIAEFLRRANQMEADLQVLATSRPTGYTDEFDPELYWHLELTPMSTPKVQDYAARWISAKVQIGEEKQRMSEILGECQQEAHTRLLLTTPLQVSIVLLIIKDGGRPPAQREELFQNYWSTIFRREKAKTKDTIRTEEQVLFDLHAYFGYLLHRRSSKENVRSLLPRDEFLTAVSNFLRARDSRTAGVQINRQATQMIKEANDRLYLLVSPEPGYFGFELRSLQEFFAAAYLAQTAKDTIQRFERLRAIAVSEHWRNVVLFFAGRIVRIFSGEAANVLELVCRPLDREPDAYYRRSGAWLALEIAADAAFASSRDLQYGVLEYALSVLQTPPTKRHSERLKALLRRISSDDRQEILRPILERALHELPIHNLVLATDVYVEFFGPNDHLKTAIERLVSSNQEQYIKKAVSLGLDCRLKSTYFIAIMRFHWTLVSDALAHKVWSSWSGDHQYVETLLASLSLGRSDIEKLPKQLMKNPWQLSHEPLKPQHEIKLENMKLINGDISSPYKQLITSFYFLMLLRQLMSSATHYRRIFGEDAKLSDVGVWNISDNLQRRRDLVASTGYVDSISQGFLSHTSVAPQLMASAMLVQSLLKTPTNTSNNKMLSHCLKWKATDAVPESFWSFYFGRTWPVAGALLDKALQANERIRFPKTYAGFKTEMEISNALMDEVHNLKAARSANDWRNIVLSMFFDIPDPRDFPQANKIAVALGLNLYELLNTSLILLFIQDNRDPARPSHIKRFLRKIAARSTTSSDMGDTSQEFFMRNWSVDTPTLQECKRLVKSLIQGLPKFPNALALALALLSKLIVADESMLHLWLVLVKAVGSLAPETFTGNERTEAPFLQEMSRSAISKLKGCLESTDPVIRQGAIVTWAFLLESLEGSAVDESAYVTKCLRRIRLDWQKGIKLLRTDNRLRQHGIWLLLASDIPFNKRQVTEDLLNETMGANNGTEALIWARFLRSLAITRPKVAPFREFLESILGKQDSFRSEILDAAAARYFSLVGEFGPDTIGEGIKLGLPAITPNLS